MVFFTNILGLPRGELRVIERFVKPGNTVFDVGAHVGQWSSHALKTAADIELFSFEPTPKTFEQLKKNIPAPNVRMFNIAMGKDDGLADFICYETEISHSSFWHWKQQAKPQTISVQVRSLDSFCAEHRIRSIDLLKIDTEGAEFFVLSGAKRMLEARRIKIIQFEYTDHPEDNLERLYNLLMSYGFAIYKIGKNKGLCPIKKWHKSLENHKYSNFLAILRD